MDFGLPAYPGDYSFARPAVINSLWQVTKLFISLYVLAHVGLFLFFLFLGLVAI